MSFELDKEQIDKVREWVAPRRVDNYGAIGGQFTYAFTPTTLGCVCKVVDGKSKEEIDVTHYDWW